MNKFVSKLAPIITEYLEYRKTLGYHSLNHEVYLTKFDFYCHEHHPDLETLTRDSVYGWLNHEISQGRRGIYDKAASARKLAKYTGNGAYILPHKAVKEPSRYVPYILSDDELSRLFLAADNIKSGECYKKSTNLKLIFPTLLRLI
ncbi:MAG: hypothetical protein LBC86_04710 [Oscillospiraceae bacterium]|jgi:hypothetical protein|nr:hypothetical protein [Oscillospiraceae bacterium]